MLQTECRASAAFDPAATPPNAHPKYQPFQAIWDTGATGSVITQAVVDACGLKPTGMKQVFGVGGPELAETYLVNIGLPNGVAFSNVEVTKGKVLGPQMLIGMDIITTGDFSISNVDGRTIFSFRYPSMKVVDFVKQADVHQQAGKIPFFRRLPRRKH